jgi:hypothetical protein
LTAPSRSGVTSVSLALERLSAWNRSQDQKENDCSQERHQDAGEKAIGSEAQNGGREPSAEQRPDNSYHDIPEDAVPTAPHHHASQPATRPTRRKTRNSTMNASLADC